MFATSTMLAELVISREQPTPAASASSFPGALSLCLAFYFTLSESSETSTLPSECLITHHTSAVIPLDYGGLDPRFGVEICLSDAVRVLEVANIRLPSL